MNNQRRVIQHTLQTGQPQVVVSLPRNDPQLAEAALDGGAQCLKAHINVDHHASGTHFGTLTEEGPALERIVSLEIPVGIVPGDGQAMASQTDMQCLDEMGIDFYDAYLHYMPQWMLQLDCYMSTMIALSYVQKDTGFSLGAAEHYGDMIEASVIQPDGYGQPLTDADLQLYEQIVTRYPQLPVVVPTQRRITPQQLPQLLEIGVQGIIIGAVVTGDQPTTIEHTTRSFREALDAAVPDDKPSQRRPSKCR